MPTDKKPKRTVQEQQEILSILLPKLLCIISKKVSLDIDVDAPNVVTAYFNPPIPEGKRRRPRTKTVAHETIEIGEGDDSEPLVVSNGTGRKRGRKNARDTEDENNASIFTPQMRLFDVFEEPNGDYWIRVQNGFRQMVPFRFPEANGTNRTFFTIDGRDYMRALYELRYPDKAFKDLEKINTRISLKDTTAWDEKHIAVIKYLQTLALQL